jgi:hypothetical protein
LTNRQQQDTHAEDLKRETYIALMAKTHDFTSTLNRLGEAAAKKDQAAYTREREKLKSSAYPDLYTAIASVYMVGDECVMRKAVAIGAALVDYGKYIPPSLDKFNDEPIRRIFQEGRKANSLFQQEAPGGRSG